MKRQSKLTSAAGEQLRAAEQQQTQQPSALEFQTPEDLLRHDREHTLVPPAIGQRLQASTAGFPQAKTAWWKRIFRTGP